MMNSYQILKEDPVLRVNSHHNNSLLIASFCYQLDSDVTGLTLESNYVTPTVRYVTKVANYWDLCPFRIYPKLLGLFYFRIKNFLLFTPPTTIVFCCCYCFVVVVVDISASTIYEYLLILVTLLFLILLYHISYPIFEWCQQTYLIARLYKT
jgi:hypothetical protein